MFQKKVAAAKFKFKEKVKNSVKYTISGNSRIKEGILVMYEERLFTRDIKFKEPLK